MVTIIVLLILAAVTINLTIGENGIFKRAQNAVDKYEIAALEEKLKMEELTAYIDTANGDNFSEDPVKGIFSYETLKNEENIEIIMDCIIELDGQLYRAKIRGVNEEIQLESAIKVKEVEDITKPLYYFMSGDLENINVLFVSEDGIVVTCKGVNYILKYEENDRYYKMYTEKYDNKVDENPGELIGEGLETSPYLIQSIEDLVAFSLMSENKSFLYEYVSIDRDLDFNLDNSYVNPNTTEFGDVNKNGIEEPLKTELTTGAGFRPIAYGNDFKGTFNGSGYSIKNLYMNCERENKKIQSRDIDYREYVGLFGILDAGTIKNLKVTGSIKSPLDYVGGISGFVE